MSKKVAKNNIEGVKNILSEIISVLGLLIIPSTIGSMIFSEEIITLLFTRGAFDKHATELTSTALFFYSIGLFSFGIREFLSRVFYTLGDTKIPMINGVIGVILNIILNVVLSRIIGLGALALATSIAGTVTSVLLYNGLRKKIGPIGLKVIGMSMAKVLLASIVMGASAKFVFVYLTDIFSQNISLLMAIVIGFLIYLILIFILRINEIQTLRVMLKNKIRIKPSS